MASIEPEEEWAGSRRRDRIYALHVTALLIGGACFAGAIWSPRWMAPVSGAAFGVAGVAAIVARRALVTFRGGWIARSLLGDDPERAARFEHVNAWWIGLTLVTFGAAEIAWAIVLRDTLGG